MVKEERPRKEKDVKFDFTLKEYEYFCEQCLFTELQEKILKLKIKRKSNIEITMELNISESTLTREVRKIKFKIFKVI